MQIGVLVVHIALVSFCLSCAAAQQPDQGNAPTHSGIAQQFSEEGAASADAWSDLLGKSVKHDVYVHSGTQQIAIAELALKPSILSGGEPYLDISVPTHSFKVSALDFNPSEESGWGRSIRVRSLSTGTVREIAVPAEGRVSNIAWSPRGNWLSFIVKSEGDAHIWVASMRDGASSRASQKPVNMLVNGQVSNSLRHPFRTQYVPYIWLPDESAIVFAAKDEVNHLTHGEWSRINVPKTSTSSSMSEYPVQEYGAAENEYVRRLKLDRAYSKKLVSAPISSPGVEKTVRFQRGITHILARGSGPEASVATIGITGNGLYRRQAFRVDLRSYTPSVSSEVTIPATARWELRQSSSDSGVVVASIDHDEATCLLDLKVTSPQSRSEICFESRILDMVESNDALFVLLSDNTVSSISRTDMAVTNTLAIEAGVSDFLSFISPGSAECNLAVVPLVAVRRSNTAASATHVQDESGAVVTFSVLRPDFEERKSLLVAELFDEKVRLFPTGFSTCSGELFVSRESRQHPRNYFLIASGGSQGTDLTRFEDFMPEFARWDHKTLNYVRKDGIQLTAQLILPRSNKRSADGKYPAVIWQYPRHQPALADWERPDPDSNRYRDPRNTNGDHEYRRTKSNSADGEWNEYLRPLGENYIGNWLPYLLVYDGYAVVAYPDFPLIGEDGNSQYGSFSAQLTFNAEALVRALKETDVVDMQRIAVGGHSRGGTTATQLLAQTDLFAAGFSYAGPTSFHSYLAGFQFEDRTYWEYPDAYLQNSPILHADRINEPLLSMFGELDHNPRRSHGEDLHRIMRALGKTHKLIVFPGEDHVPRYLETQLRILVEVSAWLDEHMPLSAGARAETRSFDKE